MSSSTVPESRRLLQENLHILLSRLAETMQHIKTWPEAKGDDASIHVKSASQLLTNLQNVITALERVESSVQANVQSLQDCPIPLDLLDLLEFSKLNPDCFARGLLREAMGQLAGLKRRKLALELLGVAVRTGLDQRLQLQSKKRTQSDADEEGEPPVKKRKDSS